MEKNEKYTQMKSRSLTVRIEKSDDYKTPNVRNRTGIISNRKKIFYITSLILVSATAANGQNKTNRRQQDSIVNNYLKEAAVSNPVLRQAIVSTEFIGSGTVKSNLNGKQIAENKMSQIRTTVLINLPIIKWGKNSVSATFSLGHQHNSLEYPSNDPLFNSSSKDIDFDKGVVGFTANYQRIDSLFGRQIVYLGNITGITNTADQIRKVSFLAGAIIPLKQQANTRISAGVLFNIDPSISFPAIPVFTYWHRFDNSYELNVSLPQRLSLEKNLSHNLRASFSTQLGGAVAFFQLDQPNLPRDVNYTTIDLKTGPGLEYRFAKNFIVGVNAGIYTPLSARAFENNKNSNDYFFDNKLSAAPYVNVTLSLLPIFRVFK